MPLCIEETNRHVRCRRQGVTNGRCFIHERQHVRQVTEAGPELEGRCNIFMKRAGRWARCGRNQHEDHICAFHTNQLRQRERENEERRNRIAQNIAERVAQGVTLWNTIYRQVLEAGIGFEEILAMLWVEEFNNRINFDVRYEIMEQMARHLNITIENMRLAYTAVINNFILQQQQPPPQLHQLPQIRPPQIRQPPQALAHIVADNQNVHTKPVTDQTNRGLEILLNGPKTDSRFLVREITIEFLTTRKDIKFPRIMDVVNDILHWQNTKSCKNHKDYLYRKTLAGLWAMILSHKDKNELTKRLWEECSEAFGLCCDGHINRLVNVMVGFDDRFAPPIPIKEQLQNKMAAISAMVIDENEKKKLALETLNQLEIPVQEHDAWLDAF